MSEPKTEKERVYDEKIFPLMKQIIEICKVSKINMGAGFSLGVPDDGQDALLTCNTALTTDLDDVEGVRRVKLIRLAATGML